jgi:hypothetical protein
MVSAGLLDSHYLIQHGNQPKVWDSWGTGPYYYILLP